MSNKLSPELTAEKLKRLFTYDEKTGVFIRNLDLSNGLKAGEIAGCVQKHRKPYKVIKIDGVLYLCHRLAWLYVHGSMPYGLIDHKNGDGLDNRLENLRVVTNKQNIQASLRVPRHNTSGLKGASFSKKMGKWIAGISINGKRKHIGCFDTAEEAHEAYLSAKREVHFL